MKKICFALILCITPFIACAQDTDDFFKQAMTVVDEVKPEETADQAKNKASSLLDTKAPVIKIEGEHSVLPFRFEREDVSLGDLPLETSAVRPNVAVIDKIVTKYGEGPFGLSWGGTYNQIKSLGVNMERTEIKDYPNSFLATKLPKNLPDISKVAVSFGEDNLLWRILAYSAPVQDSPDAANALMLYNKYYKLLSHKYGNPQQFFTPKITIVEKTVKDEMGRDKIETSRVEEPIGGKNFLSELQSGEATLYSTFEDQKVGAALAIGVDGDGKSYIIIDFTNLEIFREREQSALNAL